jgi:nitroreductase
MPSPKRRRSGLSAWQRARIEANVVREFVRDARRYLRHSIPHGGPDRFDSMEGMYLDAATTRLYHRIEKGMTYPSPKRPFGDTVARRVNRALANAGASGGHQDFFAEHARKALDALELWNSQGEIAEDVAPLGATRPANPLDPATLATFLESRHSVRNFDPDRPIDRALIEEAVRLAGTAPSVCNRQSWRAYYFDDRAEIKQVLALHEGSRGFAQRITGVFVITFDLRAFEAAKERNQGWIDGGLFSMTLMLALHGLGLGSIPLNWSRRNEASDKLRAAARIPEHENVVMLIGTGYPAEGYRVARSARRPLSQVLRIGMPQD